MARLEFSRKTRQIALKRAGHKCEAVGPLFGFENGQRCNCDLSLGVQYDHILPAELGGDDSLANCQALCVKCHKFKTRDDIKRIRHGDRMRDKHTGVVRSKQSIQGQGFPRTEKAMKRVPKTPLVPRNLFERAET